MDDDDPIDLDELQTAVPWWPFAKDSTYRRIRSGQLGCIKIGRRVFLTRRLLREFLERNTYRPEKKP